MGKPIDPCSFTVHIVHFTFMNVKGWTCLMYKLGQIDLIHLFPYFRIFFNLLIKGFWPNVFITLCWGCVRVL